MLTSVRRYSTALEVSMPVFVDPHAPPTDPPTPAERRQLLRSTAFSLIDGTHVALANGMQEWIVKRVGRPWRGILARDVVAVVVAIPEGTDEWADRIRERAIRLLGSLTQLPIVTCLPLELLARDPREFPDASEDVKAALTALGITELWRLLAYTRPEFIAALDAAKRAGATNIATMRTLYALDALFVKEVPHIGFGTLPAELRDVPAGTPIDTIFV